MSLSPGSRLGSYEIVAAIGAGGMGVVYRASDTRLKRDVALKVIADSFAHDKALIARFQREAELLATLTHQHIAAVYGLEEIDGGRALVMELADGETLAERLTRGALPLDEALPIARQIAEALEYAHDHGILHRDLKPANIKLGDGHVKILDFGLAKAMNAAGSGAASSLDSPTLTSPAFTQAGMIIGTAAYMSPEQARGRTVDRRTDIWAFGCVLLEMLTGRRTFDGETVTDTLAAVLTRDVSLSALPASTPSAIRHLLERTLTRDPRLRLQSMGEARIAIDHAIANPGATKTEATSRPRTALLPWAVAAAALVAVSVMGWSSSRTIVPAMPDQVTFQVAYPRGLALGPGASPVVSPDERRIALVARLGLVWIHDLSTGKWTSTKAEGLRGSPIWSPDGRTMAYFTTSGSLRTMDLASGASRQVTQLEQVSDGAGGSWCQSGTILLNKDRVTSLLSVPASGGIATTVVEADRTKGELGFLHPMCLPSGQFTAVVRVRAGAFVTRRFDNMEGTRTDPDLPGPWIQLDDQHGFIANDSALMYQSFDARHQPAGDLEVVVRDIGIGQGQALVSVGRHTIAYRSAEDESERQLAWVDRRGVQIGTLDLPGDARNPQLSKDGKLLAFEVFQKGGGIRRIINVLRFADGQRQQIVGNDVDNSDPQWSANTGKLLFGRGEGGSRSFFIRDLAGTTEQPTTIPAGGNQWPTAWSPDGTRMIFSDNNLACVVAGVNGNEPRTPIRLQGALTCQFSPNGKYIAFVDGAGSGGVVVEPFPSTGARWQISSGPDSEPRWHPNGKELFFLDADDTMMSSAITLEPELKAGPPQALFRARIPAPMRTGVLFNYDVAPDGRFLINTVKPGTEPQTLHVILNWRPQSPASATSR